MTLRDIYGPRWPWLFALYLSIAIVCGYTSWSRIVIDDNGVVYTNQTSVDSLVSGLSDNPIGTARWALIRSRVLIPLLIVSANKYLGIPYNVTHDGTRLLLILLGALLFHWHLRAWFTPVESLAGTTLVLASIPITFNGFYPIATDFPELVGMTACAALLVRRRWFWMLAVFGLTTLNRENSIILSCVAVCFLYRGPDTIRTTAAVAGAIVATWWTSFSAARSIAGVRTDWIQPPEGTMRGQGMLPELIGVFVDTWPRRADSMLSFFRDPHPYNVNLSLLLVLNIFWFLPLTAWSSIPISLRRLYVGGLLGGLPIFLLVGVLNEAGRHMIPLYPLVLPAGLFVLFRHVIPNARPLADEWSHQL